MSNIQIQVPADWGELPTEASWDLEVQWVYVNRARCISWTPQGFPKLDLFKARGPAPSEGAVGLMHRAADDPKGFDGILAAVKKGDSGDDPELERAERRAVNEIEGLLAQFQEVE